MRFAPFFVGIITTMAVVVLKCDSTLGVNSGNVVEQVDDRGFSQVQVTALNNLELRIHSHMQGYLVKLKEQQTLVEWYLKSYEERKPEGRMRSSPIFTFLTMKRLTFEIVQILQNMQQLKSFGDYLEKQSLSSEWPQENDFGNVISQVLNIYNTYDLTAEDLSTGTFGDAKLGIYFDVHQCFDIGKYAVTQKQYGSACEWMNMGIRNMIGYLPIQTLTMSTYMGVIMSAIDTHNKMLKDHLEVRSNLSTEEIWKTDLFVKEIGHLTSFKQGKVRHRHIKTNGTKLLRGVSEEIKFQQLCSQKLHQGPPADMYCWYERSLYPYLILNPLKIELLKRKPFMVQIYELLPMSTRNDLIQQGNPKLIRLQATPATANNKTPSSLFHAEFSDYETSRFTPFLKKIERIVGYSDRFQSPETFYVSMYSLGGFMEPPIDSLLQTRRRQSAPNVANSGQRATLVAYLNYVHAGGFTAFPKIGVATFPTFASVVLMYEDLNATSQNPRPCPIVSGHNYLLVHSMTGVRNRFYQS